MELFKIFGTIAMDNSEAKEKLGETSGLAEKASEAFKKIGTAAVAVGKTVATVLAAGAAAVGAIAKSAMDSYADYEQLVGGVETLFGTKGAKTVEEYAELVGQSVDFVAAEFEMLQNAQTTAMENAAQAYKTAGMSANEYMDTISGFAASTILVKGARIPVMRKVLSLWSKAAMEASSMAYILVASPPWSASVT